jgi:diketogulonate reductase-like aldo/keto reductase
MGGDRLADGSIYADYRNDEHEVDAIRYSLALGQNHIDTAQLYGAGHTEEIVGRAIAGADRERLFVATKVWKSHSLRHAVPRAAEESLRKLGLNRLDLLYVHAPWDAIPMSEPLAGLCDARAAGLTRAIGVSNYSLAQLRQAVEMARFPIAATQVHYNLLDRGPVTHEYLDFCRQHEITVVAYRPVERRLLADRTDSGLVLDAAARAGCTPAQLALAWLVSQPGVVAIPKASEPAHIDENLGAMGVRLDADLRRRLDGACT